MVPVLPEDCDECLTDLEGVGLVWIWAVEHRAEVDDELDFVVWHWFADLLVGVPVELWPAFWSVRELHTVAAFKVLGCGVLREVPAPGFSVGELDKADLESGFVVWLPVIDVDLPVVRFGFLLPVLVQPPEKACDATRRELGRLPQVHEQLCVFSFEHLGVV